jgi:hypothetical protein
MASRARTATSFLVIVLSQVSVACVVERNPSLQTVTNSDSSHAVLAPLTQGTSDAPPTGVRPTAVHTCRAAPSGIATVRDTSDYENETGAGRVGLLYLSNVFIDSVDIDFGVHLIGRDSLLFLPVIGDAVDDHVLYDGTTCLKLASKLPYLDSYFSSPNVEKNRLHYWGLRKLSESAYAIYAMRFDFGRSHLDSVALDTMDLRTDYRFHFAAPKVVADGIEYKAQARTYMVDSSYARIVRKTTQVPPAT